MLAHLRSPSFVELYTPKLHTVLREQYGFKDLRVTPHSEVVEPAALL